MSRSTTTTLLIHGPFTSFTIFTLYKYKDLYNIVLVGPKADTSKAGLISEINKLATDENNNISVLIYGDVLSDAYNNRQNKFLHFFSVSLGLEACVTDYIIKTRSDEFYSDLEHFEEQVIGNPKKITTNDVFFRNIQRPFHPSDHLMGGHIKNMKGMFNGARDWCMVEEQMLHDDAFVVHLKERAGDKVTFVAAEQYLGINAIKFMMEEEPEEIPAENIPEIMNDYFHIVSTKDLGFYRIIFNSAKDGPVEYTDRSFFDPMQDISDVRDYGKFPKKVESK